MEKIIKQVNVEDVIPTVFENGTCARLITKEREGSEKCSFHIHHWQAGYWSKDTFSPKSDEASYLIEGEAEVAFDGEAHQWPVGAVLYVPVGQKYKLHPKTDLTIAVVKAPPTLRSDWAAHPDLVALEPENTIRKK